MDSQDRGETSKDSQEQIIKIRKDIKRQSEHGIALKIRESNLKDKKE